MQKMAIFFDARHRRRGHKDIGKVCQPFAREYDEQGNIKRIIFFNSEEQKAEWEKNQVKK